MTGAAGFIGSHTSHRLLDRGDEVVGLDNLIERRIGKQSLGFAGTKAQATAKRTDKKDILGKVQAEDLTFVKGGLREDVGGDALAKEAEAYLERLRSQAKIFYQ